MSELEQLAVTLFEIGAVRFGRFQLHSGKQSPIYIDLRLLISHPTVLRRVAQAYGQLLQTLEYDLLAAIPYAGLPIGTAIALEIERPLIFPRKTAKSYGTGRQIEGKWQVGQRAVIVEDLITSGDSILQGIAALKAVGLEVQDAVVLIDRQQGGAQTLADNGYTLHAVLRLEQILNTLEAQARITRSQQQQILREMRGR
jgi:uridine monophosphate synthetase